MLLIHYPLYTDIAIDCCFVKYMSKYLINHPLSVSDQNLFLSRFSAKLSLSQFVYFPSLCNFPCRQHTPVDQLEGEFCQNNMKYFICFSPQRFFTVQTSEDRRYCIVQMVGERSIGYVQRTRTVGIILRIRYIVSYRWSAEEVLIMSRELVL